MAETYYCKLCGYRAMMTEEQTLTCCNRTLDEINEEYRIRKEAEYRIGYYENHRNDINYRLESALRSKIYIAIKTGYKIKSAMELLGCDIPTVRQYLENNFMPGMTWENWGRLGWNIDHIRPVASFDLRTRENQLKCFNYKNLRPLWQKENSKKGALWEGKRWSKGKPQGGVNKVAVMQASEATDPTDVGSLK